MEVWTVGPPILREAFLNGAAKEIKEMVWTSMKHSYGIHAWTKPQEHQKDYSSQSHVSEIESTVQYQGALSRSARSVGSNAQNR